MKILKLLLLTLYMCIGFCASALALEIVDDGEDDITGQKEVIVGEEFYDVPNVRTEYIISNSNVAQLVNGTANGRKKIKFINPGYTMISFIYPDGWETNGRLLKRVNLFFMVKDKNGSTGVNGTSRDYYKGGGTEDSAVNNHNSTSRQYNPQPKIDKSNQTPSNNANSNAMLMLQYVNEARARVGAKPLVLVPDLNRRADIRAKEISIRYEHTRPDGSDAFTVLNGYSFMGAGENIYASPKTAKIAFDGWMNSPGHKKNILNPRFGHLGVGYYYYGPNTKSKHYWVQLFTD